MRVRVLTQLAVCAFAALSGAACGGVTSDPADAGSLDATTIDSPLEFDAALDAAAVVRACRDLPPGMASGTFTIRPDGQTAVEVACDLTTEGGGWTLIFIAGTNNYETTTLTYGLAQPTFTSLLQYLDSVGATEVLIAHRNTELAELPVVASLGLARFPIPPRWRLASPFEVDADEATVLARINGGAATSTVIRFGYRAWGATGDTCGNAGWNAAGTLEGRVCLDASAAPGFTEFSNSRTDACETTGALIPSATGCSTTRRFSIAVR